MKIDFLEFSNARTDSLTWYDFLPGDDIHVSCIPIEDDNSALIDRLLDVNLIDIEHEIDVLAARLLNQEIDISYSASWYDLCHMMSELMSSNLTSVGSRSIRMRAQRLNYYLQSFLSASLDNHDEEVYLHEEKLVGDKAWDQVLYREMRWWLTSEENNIHCQVLGELQHHWSVGLPTQLDILSDGRLSVGSIYSPGACLVDGSSWTKCDHEVPIVLFFNANNETYFLDHKGNIIRYDDRVLIYKVNCRQVHFARWFDGKLYCMDNSDFGHITSFDFDSSDEIRHAVLPVMVCNDIAVVASDYYLIDKQQGSVFKFDSNWEFVSRVLRFGRQEGCLLDPVSLRHHDETLQIVSWLTSKLTTIKLF